MALCLFCLVSVRTMRVDRDRVQCQKLPRAFAVLPLAELPDDVALAIEDDYPGCRVGDEHQRMMVPCPTMYAVRQDRTV
eukprot:SAG22_NODE_655_length_8104_cov_6.498438_6_plen_79_part_00